MQIEEPKVKDWRDSGSRTKSMGWLKRWPKAKFSSSSGRWTCSKLWLNSMPKVMLFRCFGKETSAKVVLKRCPTLKVFREAGRALRLWLNRSPSIKCWRPSGSTPGPSAWLKTISQFQTQKGLWKCHMLQAMIETSSQRQRFQSSW